MGASCGLILEAASLTLRCVVAIIVAFLAAACGCALVADINSLLYGLEAHQTWSALVAHVPSQAISFAILVLPSVCCWCCLQPGGGRCLRWQNSCVAALVAGLLLGVLAGPPPGPYMAHVRDADLREETDGIHVKQRAVREDESDL